MRPFSAYIFDLDGTLADSLPGIEFSVHAAIEQVCPERGFPSLRNFVGPPIGIMLQRALGITDKSLLDALVAAFRRSYDEIGWMQTQLYDGAESVLETLAAHPARLFVLTNKPAPATERILRHLDLWRLFERVVAPKVTANSRHNKVDAARALQISAKLSSDATLLIGDSRDDALAAAACKFSFAAVQFGYGDASSQTEAPIAFNLRHLAELPPSIATHIYRMK